METLSDRPAVGFGAIFSFFSHVMGATIVRQIQLAAGLIAVTTVILASLGFYGLASLQRAEGRSLAVVDVVRNHGEIDMLHDAIHASVYQALFAASKRASGDEPSIRDQLRKTLATLDRLVAANESTSLPADVRQLGGKTARDMHHYAQSATALIDTAFDYKPETEDQRRAFDQEFRKLENSLGMTTSLLMRRLETEARSVSWLFAMVNLLLIVCGFTASLYSIGLVIFLKQGIAQPVRRVTRSLREPNADVVVTLARELARTDEIGALARGVADFRAAEEDARSAIQRATALEQAAQTERTRADQRIRDAAEAERRASLVATAQNLDAKIGGIAAMVRQTSTQLKQTAADLSQSAENSSQHTTAAAIAAEQTLRNVTIVTDAADKLALSVTEVSTRLTSITESGRDAKELSAVVTARMAGLSSATDKIGRIAALIAGIAAKTNLLALNATIEAARAGDAGRGFAIVASEVKALANQTSTAVVEIDNQIAAISSATIDASTSIGSVTSAIDALNETTNAIALAAKEQGIAAGEINRTIHQAALGTDVMHAGLKDVGGQSTRVATSARTLVDAAGTLDTRVAQLGDEIADFIAKAKAA